MEIFIDTHCHLNFKDFDTDIDQVISLAHENGIHNIIVPGVDLATSQKAVELSMRYPQLYAAIGVHPGYVDQWSSSTMEELYALTTHPKVIAIGEIGLDLYHRTDNLDLQQQVLSLQLDLAVKANKPVILHSRNAVDETLETIQKCMSLSDQTGLSGVFHSYEGSLNQAHQIINLGFMLGVGGRMSYPANTELRKTLQHIGVDHLLLETDAPYLSPGNLRGQRNLPSHIPIIAACLSKTMKHDIQTIALSTTNNAINLFSLRNTDG